MRYILGWIIKNMVLFFSLKVNRAMKLIKNKTALYLCAQPCKKVETIEHISARYLDASFCLLNYSCVTRSDCLVVLVLFLSKLVQFRPEREAIAVEIIPVGYQFIAIFVTKCPFSLKKVKCLSIAQL